MPGLPWIYSIGGALNAPILDDTTTSGPALPTISELDCSHALDASWVWKGRRGLHYLRNSIYLPNGDFLTHIKSYQHLDDCLADPASTASDVYAVSRLVGAHKPFGSLHHWSFYTQGVFYHLSAPDLPRETMGKSQNAVKSRGVGCLLKREEMRILSSEARADLQKQSRGKPLHAYKIGQTDYKPEQILQIAQRAVDQFSAYSLSSANCQHFVSTMVRRTVMRLCDRSTFAGTALQIADWDLKRGLQPHVNCIEHGFTISPALPLEDTLWARRIYELFHVHGYTNIRTIRTLYKTGPRDESQLNIPDTLSDLFKTAYIELRTSIVDMKEDLKRQRWKDALYGRYQLLPDGTARRPMQVPGKYRRATSRDWDQENDAQNQE